MLKKIRPSFLQTTKIILMENTFAKVEELTNSVKEYVNNSIESAKLTVAEKSSLVIANLAGALIMLLFFILFVGFASVALAISLSEWIGKPWAGYLIVAGLHLLLILVIWSARSRLIRFPVMNMILKQLFRSDEEDQ